MEAPSAGWGPAGAFLWGVVIFTGNNPIYLVLLFSFGVLVQVSACSGGWLCPTPEPQTLSPWDSCPVLPGLDSGSPGSPVGLVCSPQSLWGVFPCAWPVFATKLIHEFPPKADGFSEVWELMSVFCKSLNSSPCLLQQPLMVSSTIFHGVDF